MVTRTFVPQDFNPDSVSETRGLYRLLAEAEIPGTAQALRAWILKWSELESVLAEVSSRRYVAMTCATSDPRASKAYSDFIVNIDPLRNEYGDILNRKLMAHPKVKELEGEFGEWIRSVKVDLDLFQEKNIPLQTEENQQIQAYQKITGAMSVEYQGSTRTLQQMSTELESPDRKHREEVWRLLTERRLQDRERLDEAFDKLFRLRIRIAENTGHSDFLDYIFLAKRRFSYTPADCREFHESIEKLVLPVLRDLYRKRAGAMGLGKLRPWDLACDERARPALKPFRTGEELIEKCGSFFGGLHPKTARYFAQMQKLHLIDPDSRVGKAPGGYQIGFDESRLPFIFMNAAASDRDVYTLLHESGHSFHQFEVAEQPIITYRDVPAEFAEVASMSMELIGTSDLSAFYPAPEERARSIQNELEEVIWLFPWVASIDSFQMELYSRPKHTASDRKDIWLSVMDRFDAGVDYTGLDDARAYLWQKQLHLFECPFYYIEYGIAQLGALQVWANFKKDPEKALDTLFKAESLGSSRPVSELFSAAGIRFDFSPKTIEPLMRQVCDELDKL